ncbi:MAG: glycosyltransferase family 39 protein [Alphaproteobacteria bacterium]|nr:glycosyltransferase family 39 protein [Alphaproteobacteria bacterium]
METSPMQNIYTKPALLAAFICLALMIAAQLARPLFPVDETRYLTVAWEMHQSGNYVLPSLNHEAYHHKPPVLFWLINLMWAIFGVSQGAAMVVPYLGAFAFLLATARLATRLFPDNAQAPLLTTALLAGSLPFVIYSNLIMFDLLLGVFAILGLTAVWDYMTTRSKKHLLLLALCIGFGVLTKGPVILLHIGTALLLAKIWINAPQAQLKKTILPLIGAVLLGAAIALSWAIPAAIEGGKEFADKIFWGQTAGRMVKAFDHQRPIYWYLTFVPLFTLPWLASPALWSGAKQFLKDKAPNATSAKRFLFCWAVPVFVSFCLISGKQVHYLIPILPALALFFTGAFLNAPDEWKKRDSLPVLVTTLLLAALPIIMNLFANKIGGMIEGDKHIEETFSQMALLPSSLAALFIFGVSIAAHRSKIKNIVAITLSMAAMMVSFQIAAKESFFANYNLTPLAEKIMEIDKQTLAQNEAFHPLAFTRNYHGEFGFLARLNRPVKQIQPDELSKWFNDNPNGIALVRSKNELETKPYHVLYEQPYKLSSGYAIVETKKE